MIYERKTGLNVPRHEQQQQKLHKTWKEKPYITGRGLDFLLMTQKRNKVGQKATHRQSKLQRMSHIKELEPYPGDVSSFLVYSF